MESSHVVVLGPQPRLHRVFVAVGALLVSFSAGWAGFFPVEVVVRAPGVIRPATTVSSVKNPVAGRVRTKEYRSGSRVDAGSVLWQIDTKATETDRYHTLAQLGQVRRQWQEAAELSAAIESGNRLGGSRRSEAYFAHLDRLELLAASKRDRWTRETSLPAELTMAQTVVDLWDESRLADLEVLRFRAQERDAAFEEMRRLLGSLGELESHLAQTEKTLAESVVTTPITGVAEDLKKFNPGDFLLSGEELVRVVPAPREGLTVELMVDPRDIGELRVGQLVHVLFPGLAPSRYGATEGEVETVAADASVSNGQASFVVEVPLRRGWLQDRSGRRVLLKAGMPVDARILVGKKTILGTFLEKLEFLP